MKEIYNIRKVKKKKSNYCEKNRELTIITKDYIKRKKRDTKKNQNLP